jgi:hypothetical protein
MKLIIQKCENGWLIVEGSESRFFGKEHVATDVEGLCAVVRKLCGSGETTKRYVKTDRENCIYLTAGKVYEATDWDFDRPISFSITDDQEEKIHCLLEGCYHLYGRNWIECDADGEPK